MPVRLAFASAAMPFAAVVAEPTALPFTVKETDFPLTGLPPDVRVAETVVEPPYVPVAAVGVRLPVAARTTSGAAMGVVAPPHAVLSTAMMFNPQLPGAVAAVVTTV